MPADPVAAGRKGGQSRSAAKLAAIRRNGFQKVKSAPATEQQTVPVPESTVICARKNGATLLVAQ